jgi:hypothetical protein
MLFGYAVCFNGFDRNCGYFLRVKLFDHINYSVQDVFISVCGEYRFIGSGIVKGGYAD